MVILYVPPVLELNVIFPPFRLTCPTVPSAPVTSNPVICGNTAVFLSQVVAPVIPEINIEALAGKSGLGLL
ncbi:hypothetical protein D3C87_1656880 [compost metagenome]